MAKWKSTKLQTTITHKTKDRAAQSTKIQGWSQVLRKGIQFLLHYWLPSCYSSYKSGDKKKSWIRKGPESFYKSNMIRGHLLTVEWLKVGWPKILELIVFTFFLNIISEVWKDTRTNYLVSGMLLNCSIYINCYINYILNAFHLHCINMPFHCNSNYLNPRSKFLLLLNLSVQISVN